MAIVNRFIITGSQRSGTTLLGMALQAHPDIELIEEDDSNFHPFHGLTKQLDLQAVELYAPELCAHIGYKAPRDAHRIDKITGVFPSMRILWISRNIFQVVASMVSLRNRRIESWAIVFAPKEIIKYLHAIPSDNEIRAEFQLAMSIIDTRVRAITLSAICWLVKQRSEIAAIQKMPDSNYQIYYDDLVCSPEDSLAGILTFLEIPWSPQVLDHASSINGKRPGGSSTARNIDLNSLSKWKTDLSIDDITVINSLLQRHSHWLPSTEVYKKRRE